MPFVGIPVHAGAADDADAGERERLQRGAATDPHRLL
jgi:hypothetical protein